MLFKRTLAKQGKPFFALGSIGTFHGSLNPLSGRSIFETCIIPTLLYGCDTWLLDSTTVKLLENFQCEIGRRILHLPKYHSKKMVRLELQWPSVAIPILIHKLTFLAKRISSTDDKISARIFTSLAIVDVYNLGIVQQGRMLEVEVGTNVLAMCLKHPADATAIVKAKKKEILKFDFAALLSSSATHPAASAKVAKTTSWCRLWDLGLDRGVHGTRGLQLLLRVLSQRIYAGSSCPSCGAPLCPDSFWLNHICQVHSDAVNYLSCEEIICSLIDVKADLIFSVATSKLNNICLAF